MTDILDAAQQTTGSDTPVSSNPPIPQDTSAPARIPAVDSKQRQQESLDIVNQSNPQPPKPPEENSTLVSVSSPDLAGTAEAPPPSITTASPADSALVDELLESSKTAVPPVGSVTGSVPEEPAPPSPQPPKKGGVNLSKGIILSLLLFLFVTLPLVAYYASQHRQIAEIRSQAAGPYPDGTLCVNNSDCASGICGRDPADNSRACLPAPTTEITVPPSNPCTGYRPNCSPNYTPTCISGQWVCYSTTPTLNTPCTQNSDCASNICALDSSGQKHCALPAPTACTGYRPTCSTNYNITCVNGQWICYSETPSNNTPCTNNSQCASNNCVNGYCALPGVAGAGCDRSSPNTFDCTDKSSGASCTRRPEYGGGTGTCKIINPGGANSECECSVSEATPSPGNNNNPPGNNNPTGSGTPPPSGGQCNNIQVYKNGTLLTAADLTSLQPGDNVNISVIGTSATKGRVRVNGGDWAESTTKDTSGGYTVPFTVPAGITNFTIEGQLFVNGAWQ